LGLIPDMGDFSPIKSIQTGYEAHPASVFGQYQRLFPSEVKRQGHEADHSPPSSAEIKNGAPVSSHPNMSSWRLHGGVLH
jgi:hypothetical protein